jgi:hypothetical protein
MRLRSNALVLATALLALPACHSGRAEDTGSLPAPANANAAVPLVVENHNTNQMDIYALRTSGERIRVGEAGSLATTTLKIPRDYLDTDGSVQLIAAPVGAPGTVRTGRLTVQPGQIVKWMIQADPSMSSAVVE